MRKAVNNEKCREIKPRRCCRSLFLIHKATQGVTAQGKDYMTLYLQDKSGDIEAKLWTVTKDDMKILEPEKLCMYKVMSLIIVVESK